MATAVLQGLVERWKGQNIEGTELAEPHFDVNLGHAVFNLIPEADILRYIPFNDVRFVSFDRLRRLVGLSPEMLQDILRSLVDDGAGGDAEGGRADGLQGGVTPAPVNTGIEQCSDPSYIVTVRPRDRSPSSLLPNRVGVGFDRQVL